MIDENLFFDTFIKNKEEAYEQIIEMGRNNDYTTSNLLDYEYFSKHCRLIVIDLSKQIELGNHDLKQKINFIERIEMDEGATMFFITGKSEETNFEFTQNSSTIVWLLTIYKMETQKIVNLLKNTDNESSEFATRESYVINDQNNAEYGERNNINLSIKFETKVIKASLCDYSDSYVLLTGDMTATGGNANTKVAFKNCASFRRCITLVFDWI